MAENSSSNLPIKLLWQLVLVIALVLGAWVLGQVLPIGQKKPVTDAPPQNANLPAQIKVYQLPRSGQSSSPLEAINTRLAGAKKEIIVATRQIASSTLLKTIQQRQAAGVSVTLLLSPDTLPNFAGSKLAEWMRENKLTGVYRDMMNSASYLMVIDGETVILSDLPFSEGVYAPATAATIQKAALGFVYIIDDPTFAQTLSVGLKGRAISQNKLL